MDWIFLTDMESVELGHVDGFLKREAYWFMAYKKNYCMVYKTFILPEFDINVSLN